MATKYYKPKQTSDGKLEYSIIYNEKESSYENIFFMGMMMDFKTLAISLQEIKKELGLNGMSFKFSYVPEIKNQIKNQTIQEINRLKRIVE